MFWECIAAGVIVAAALAIVLALLAGIAASVTGEGGGRAEDSEGS